MVTPLDELLAKMVEVGASDLHLKVGSPPVVRIAGDLHPTKLPVLVPDDTITYAESIFTPKAAATFRSTNEANFAYGRREFGRFRVNVFRQRGSVGVVMRRVLHELPSFEELGLPPALGRLRSATSGLVIVAGPSSAGKTTTLGSLVDYINRTRAVNIVTFEDPIEVVHTDQRSIVSQREIGMDTDSYASALENVLRQDPDVIMIDRMKDTATVRAVLAAAEMGHLVLASMSTVDAVETITRLFDFFPDHMQKQIRSQLAGQLLAVVCQRLLERADGRGMVPAVELLMRSEELADCIVRQKRPSKLIEVMESSASRMQTYDQSIAGLYTSGLISYETAAAAVAEPDALRRIPEVDAKLVDSDAVVAPPVPEPVVMSSDEMQEVQPLESVDEVGYDQPGFESVDEVGYDQPGFESVDEVGYDQPGFESVDEVGYDQPGFQPVDEVGYDQPGFEPVDEVGYDQPGFEPEGEGEYSQSLESGHADDEAVPEPDLSTLPPPPPTMFTTVGSTSDG